MQLEYQVIKQRVKIASHMGFKMPLIVSLDKIGKKLNKKGQRKSFLLRYIHTNTVENRIFGHL